MRTTFEANPERIARLAEEQREADFAFRRFLKASSLSDARLDAAFRAALARVSAAIDCTACGHCCRALRPLLQAGDIRRLAEHLQVTDAELHAQHLEPDDAGDGYWFRARPCPFLDGNRCTVYAARPDACRSYPHLHKRGMRSRLRTVVTNCAVCPIAFNVYEELKHELWHEKGRLR
jgi:hypothetical protein